MNLEDVDNPAQIAEQLHEAAEMASGRAEIWLEVCESDDPDWPYDYAKGRMDGYQDLAVSLRTNAFMCERLAEANDD